jgi:hypothetical protein
MVGRRTLRALAHGGRGKRMSEEEKSGFNEDLYIVRGDMMMKYRPTDNPRILKCDDKNACNKGKHARGSVGYNNEGEYLNTSHLNRKQHTNKAKKPVTKRKTCAKKK